MIVGTAGHIDHGKTTLVRALTGVDTDRLPQEKERGISIELGYAYLPTPAGGSIGFIDVPGHERLVHTMLAGATGIDHALLLVAADDGPMPQTREHLAVLSLLGLRGTLVVTKADRVDAARLDAVGAEALALVAGTSLDDAPVFSVGFGAGIDALRSHLFALAATNRRSGTDGPGFRLSVDRSFTLDGIGTVATGTVHAGRVEVGDELALIPAAGGPRLLRVRGLHAQNRRVQHAAAGERCAIALAAIAKDEVRRGDWLCSAPIALTTQRLDVALTVWPGESRPLRPAAPVHLHLGASDVLASVALLDVAALAPGATGLAQLVLQQPVAAWRGDRLVLRDASASRTIAGGRVLDPLAPARYRRTPERLAVLAAAARPERRDRLQALIAASAHGVALSAWCRVEGWQADATPLLPAGVVHTGDWALAPAQWQRLGEQTFAALDRFHATQPDELGPDAARLRRLAAPRLPDDLWHAVLAAALAEGQIVRRGVWLHRPAHGVRLSAAEERVAQKVLPLLEGGGFDPPWLRDLAASTREPQPLLRTTLARMGRRGEIFQVVTDLYYHARWVERLAAEARGLAARDGEVRTAAFRDATGLGRKRAIQILEFFDRAGLLRRVGDSRRLRGDPALFSSTAGR